MVFNWQEFKRLVCSRSHPQIHSRRAGTITRLSRSIQEMYIAVGTGTILLGQSDREWMAGFPPMFSNYVNGEAVTVPLYRF